MTVLPTAGNPVGAQFNKVTRRKACQDGEEVRHVSGEPGSQSAANFGVSTGQGVTPG